MLSTKPSILLMLQLPPPVHGASVMNQIVASSDWLRRRFDLDVIDINMNKSVKTLRAFSLEKLVKALGLGLRLVGTLARRRPNLVYLTLAPTGFAFYRDLAFIAILKLFGSHRIYHLHGRGIDDAVKGSALRRAVYRWAFAGADIISLCHASNEDIRRVADPRRIQIVNNGIEDPFPELALEPARCTGRVTAGPARILFLSNMIVEKGPVVLLEALAILVAMQIEFAADFAGGWRPPLDEARFRALVDAKGLRERVTVHGPAYGERKRALMTAASIFVLPTYYRFETFPVSILEAMAAGLAIVSTRHGGIPEMIESGGNDMLVPTQDAAALAEALAGLLADPIRARVLGQKARSRFEQRFTADAFEHRLANALSALVAGNCLDVTGLSMNATEAVVAVEEAIETTARIDASPADSDATQISESRFRQR